MLNAHEVNLALTKYARKHSGYFPRDASEANKVLLTRGAGYLNGDRLSRTPWHQYPRELGQADGGNRALHVGSDGYTLLEGAERVPYPKHWNEYGAILYAGSPDGKQIHVYGIGRVGDQAALVYRSDEPEPEPRPTKGFPPGVASGSRR